jgi:hypothetical protein
MADRSSHRKTFGDLVGIYKSCRESYESDPSNDRRIDEFFEDMKNGNWDGSVVITYSERNGYVTDGVHRGVAYLLAREAGLHPRDLPQLEMLRR